MTLGGNRTMAAPVNPAANQFYVLTVKQDATGGRARSHGTPPTTFRRWAARRRSPPSPDKSDKLVFVYEDEQNEVPQHREGALMTCPASPCMSWPGFWAARAGCRQSPIGFRVSEGYYARITLNWDNPDDDSITSWEYRFRSQGGDWEEWTAIADSVASTTTVNFTVTRDMTYEFQVRAVNDIGNGPESDAVEEAVGYRRPDADADAEADAEADADDRRRGRSRFLRRPGKFN